VPAPASTAALQKAPAAVEASSILQDVQSPSRVPVAGLADPVVLEVLGAVEGPMALSTKPWNAVDEIVPDAQRDEQSAPLQRQLQHSDTLSVEDSDLELPETMVKTKRTVTGNRNRNSNAMVKQAEKLIKDSQVQMFSRRKVCCC